MTTSTLATTSSGGVLGAGNTLNVVSGGTAATWLLGGTENVSAGGHDSGSQVASGGIVVASSGGTVTSDVVTSGARLVVASGGSVASSLISGTLELQAGATGILPTTANPFPNSNIIASGATVALDSGGAFSGLVVGTGQSYVVSSGARVTSDVVSSGGTVTVLNGGVATSDTILVGGGEIVSSGGSVVGDILSAGTVLLSGGTAAGDVVLSLGNETLFAGAVATGTLVSSGGLQTVSGGGTAIGTTVVAGANLTVAGGTTSGVVLSGGAETLSSGSLAVGTVVSAGSFERLGAGATASNTLVLAHGNVAATSGATVVGSVISGGLETVSAGATDSNAMLFSGGRLFVSSGGVASGATVSSGGTENVSSGGAIAGTTNVSSGGALVLSGLAGSGAIDLVGNGARVTVSGTTLPTNVISHFGGSDIIDFASIVATGFTTSGDSLTIQAGLASYTLNVVGVGTGQHVLASDGAGGTFFEVCFAAGTRIATPGAEMEVERLAVGDLVTTLDGPRPVTWIGHRSVDVTCLADPDSGRLVRVRKGAFAVGVPRRDLLVTQEHCLFVDAKLIPARMLVNGRSIVIDRGIAAYTFYHVELAQHAILLAEGLTTESYLDTGNRANFADSATPALQPDFTLDVGHKSWATHAAAPLCVDRAVVEPIWARLEARAREMGLTAAAPAALVSDPALHLVADDGTQVAPISGSHGRVVFAVPPGVSRLRLRSRTARPSQTVGPFLDDRRALGVLVGEIAVWRGAERSVAASHLTDAALPGWFAVEGGPHRWTDGDAVLPLALGTEPALIDIEVVNAGPYLAHGDAGSSGRLAAGRWPTRAAAAPA